ncbi:DUF2202 domain-containing protein [Actinoplanes sp. N902-109]|uniref:ferritin-like domain-containing protein n=1 Tax=Actinoplanes sp. (strain N902-109) TaxID=649831 RepID=UPI0003293703|nr:DUF2202 domain-containing protein [Actinoplanes sp. N902-109]AGL16026.1 hypothetical protein L083_2516 [Actinoplanes sp. N902-109]
MKTMTHRTATLVAAGALGLGGLAIAAPVLAGSPSGPGPVSSYGAVSSHGMVSGYGMGAGHSRVSGYGTGAGQGAGGCPGHTVIGEQGTLTAAQKTTLAAMAQEEKLARDLYAAFAARYDDLTFNHVAMAESQHLTMVRTLLQRYGSTDPTAGQPDGAFTDKSVQTTYDKLLAQGKRSEAAALSAARQVERDDIAALTAALTGLTAPDVSHVYTMLLAASQRHLAAFTR